jgi:hypothetical protein
MGPAFCRGASENPFYARQYVLAGLTTIDAAAGVKAVCVTDGRGELAGLFPFRKYNLLPLASSVAQGHPTFISSADILSWRANVPVR